MERHVYFVSDGTAITTEVFGHALLSQFPVKFKQFTEPFVDNERQAGRVLDKINRSFITTGQRPLVFHTIVDAKLRSFIDEGDGINYDILSTFVTPLEAQLGVKAEPKIGRSHGMLDNAYHYRIEAVNYALDNDDGAVTKHYHEADIILTGVSRCGKTPTSLYLALQYGIKAANYPFTEEDMDHLTLPAVLKENKHKIYGLVIDAERLAEIRNERAPGTRYASLRQCRLETKEVELLFQRERIPYLNTTRHSVEEISAHILQDTGLERHKY
ncbi:kinase/pyrophosphorylase [Gallaecimonas kandeliae]|uniref:posphoenolpyruvate synthetase regulatory kinase/phosphorylase PpsR n=1 Tax=Gallaecimonas kandeliae TaxID=3029055 RepID=UPI00264714D6|nr:pyruvate, water dikinase regulatory protein [Gallaecimonas kandeliae]WKE67212.1 kinase/pyrophosphorylase [Gallaecimonas kandeliae]